MKKFILILSLFYSFSYAQDSIEDPLVITPPPSLEIKHSSSDGIYYLNNRKEVKDSVKSALKLDPIWNDIGKEDTRPRFESISNKPIPHSNKNSFSADNSDKDMVILIILTLVGCYVLYYFIPFIYRKLKSKFRGKYLLSIKLEIISIFLKNKS